MKREKVTTQHYEQLITIWMDRMMAFAEQLEDRAEFYPMGSRNHLELIAKATGVRASIEQLSVLEEQCLMLNQTLNQSEA